MREKYNYTIISNNSTKYYKSFTYIISFNAKIQPDEGIKKNV